MDLLSKLTGFDSEIIEFISLHCTLAKTRSIIFIRVLRCRYILDCDRRIKDRDQICSVDYIGKSLLITKEAKICLVFSKDYSWMEEVPLSSILLNLVA